MQVIAYCEEEAPADHLEQENENILHFSLEGPLLVSHTLALNMTLGTLSYLSCSDGQPQLLLQQQFTNSELSMLRPLLESFPHYCPYEVLFASFYHGTITDQMVAHYRRRLQAALETDVWEQEIRPVRNVLSRTRLKLRAFGINILSILETGYVLVFVSMPEPAGT
jgi:hypothetical protein